MIPIECEKCIHCRVCAYNNPKRKQHCGFYEESRPTGEWINEYWEDAYQEYYHTCDVCKKEIVKTEYDNYCSCCGAKMRKGEAEND